MDMQRRTMTMISKLYYEENMTQQQIAKARPDCQE